MAYVNRQPRRRDGFNMTAPMLPTLAEGKVVDGGPNPTLDRMPPEALPFDKDPQYEVDFYTLPCDVLQSKMQSLKNFLFTTKFSDPAMQAYYQDKLSQAQSAWQLNCSGKIVADGGPVPMPPEKTNDTGATPTGINPTVTLPTGSNITIGPGVAPAGIGGGGGGGGSSSSKKPAAKKINWWMWGAIAAVAIALYQTRKD